MIYETDRDALVDAMNRRRQAMLAASEWARVFVDVAPQSGCHFAALGRCLQADRLWWDAEDALSDYDEHTEDREWHEMLARRMKEPTDAEIDRAMDRMDHLFGPGWRES